MIDLILIGVFCYMINRMAAAKGVSSVSYILNYITMVILVMFLIVFGLFSFYGPDILKTEQGVKIALLFEPIAITFEVVLFLFFRNRIEKIDMHDEDGNENTHPTPPNEKKDLSYFR